MSEEISKYVGKIWVELFPLVKEEIEDRDPDRVRSTYVLFESLESYVAILILKNRYVLS